MSHQQKTTILSPIPLRVRYPAGQENSSSPSEGQGASQVQESLTIANERNPTLLGHELHGFQNYSDLTCGDIQKILPKRMLLPKEVLAILRNGQLYAKEQAYNKYPEKFILDKEEFRTSATWNKVLKYNKKLKVGGMFRLFQFTDETKNNVRYTIISADPEEENAFHLVQTRPKMKKRKETLEETDPVLYKLINDALRTLRKAKRASTSEAKALIREVAKSLQTYINHEQQ